MNTIHAFRFDRDHELTGDIVPESYFRCQAVRELAYPWDTRSFERQLTEIRAGWTDKFLYLHLWAKDSWIVARETKPKGRVFEDDCLEFYLMPEEGKYYGWEINPLGTLLDYRVEGWSSGPVVEAHFDLRWKSAAQYKVRRHDAGWVAEFKLPCAKDMQAAPSRGTTWGATFNRIDIDRRGQQSLSTFSELPSDSPVWFHQPLGFGQIVFD